MILTKRKSLKITAELWRYIAEGGQKLRWDGWLTYGHMKLECPLCEYNQRNYKRIAGVSACAACPLLGKWNGREHCFDKGSPFELWGFASLNSHERKHQALHMVELCELELERLRRERENASLC